MKQPSASPSAKKLMKFYRRENSVGVIRIKLTDTDFAVEQAAYQAAAAGALDASEQELSADIQPLTRSFAQRTLPPGWGLLPSVAAGGAIWGLIIWWLL